MQGGQGSQQGSQQSGGQQAGQQGGQQGSQLGGLPVENDIDSNMSGQSDIYKKAYNDELQKELDKLNGKPSNSTDDVNMS